MAIAELSAPRPGQHPRRAAATALAFALALLFVLVLALLGVPAPVVAVTAIAVLGLGLLTRPEVATYLFVAALYLNLPVVAVRFHGVDSNLATAITLLLGIPFMSYIVVRRQPIVLTRTLWWAVAYLTVMLVATIFSSDTYASIPSVMTFVTEGLILYLLLTNAMRSVATLRGVIIVLLVVGTALGSLSLFQELTRTYENQYGGFAQTTEQDPLEVDDSPDRIDRLSGPIGSKNRYAQAMLVLLPLSLYLWLTRRSRLQAALAIVSAVTIFAGMALTYSRGAAVALAAVVLIAVLFRYIKLRHALAAGLIMAVAVLIAFPGYASRLESLGEVGALANQQRPDDGAILGRATSNLAALNVFADHPVLGVGPGRYQADFSQQYANELGLRRFTTPRRAHNLYLEVAADTGVLGVVAFLGIVGTTLHGLWQARKRWMRSRPDHAHLAMALFLSVMGYLLSGVFLHLAYIRYFWLLMAIANSVIWVLSRQPDDAEQAPRDGLAA